MDNNFSKKELQRLKNDLLKKINSDSKIKPNMIKTMEEAQELLKQIDFFNTKSEICLINDKKIEKTDLCQYESLYNLYFFVTMLGFIDAKIDQVRINISLLDGYIDEYNYDSQYRKNSSISNSDFIRMALLDRDEIIENYRNVNNKQCTYSVLFLDVISSQPSYMNFKDLYIDSMANDDFSVQQQLINAYNVGYIDSDRDYYEVFDKYRELLNDLVKNIQYNLDEISIQKGVYKKKSRWEF